MATRHTPSRGPACPAFKSKDSVLERPNDEMAGSSTVVPGCHAMPGGYSVVWWDPAALDLGVPRLFGVRRDDLIVKDVARNVVADGRGRYDRWRLGRLDARAAGSVPSLEVATLRDWTADDSHELPPSARAVDVQVARAHRAGTDGHDDERTGGAAFGALVHAVLAQAPLDGDLEAIDRIARIEARAVSLDERAAAEAASVVHRVFRHELLSRARAAAARGACRRETPVTYRLPGGPLIEGIVDLAFEEAGAWTIVDYKTDREIRAAGEERYRRQVALYAAAIAQATGKAATGIVMRI
jgi:hypothetical protein